MSTNLRSSITILPAVFALLLLAVLVPPAAAQTKYAVKTLRYENKGAYLAIVTVKYGECEASLYGIAAGQSVDYELGGHNNHWNWNCTKYPWPGDEVSMTIYIKSGDKQDCDKDSTKFIFRRNGGTVKFVTKGTTLNDNRCQIAKKPSDDHIIQ